MSTDTLSWAESPDIDSPWRRLYFTLPSALLICGIALFLFSYFMEHPAIETPAPAPVDAELVEMAAPAESPPPSSRHPVAQPKAAPPIQPHAPPVAQQQAPEATAPAARAEPAPPPSAAAPASPQAPASGPVQDHAAQAVARPLPLIPDDLREEAMNAVATARFHVSIDGVTTVELIKPTQNPRLNRLLLEALKQWKFSPALKDGHPAPSAQDIVIHVQVE